MSDFKAGDTVLVCEAGGTGLHNIGKYVVDEVSLAGMLRLHDRGDFNSWVHPCQCELIDRPKKTAKAKVWVPFKWEKPSHILLSGMAPEWGQIEVEVEE